MHIHHFYPRTRNIGDHFVQKGIEQIFLRLAPGCTFEFFNVNSRGEDKHEYGLTHTSIERANCEADLIVIGGSNLYEGSFRWPWGIHLEVAALKRLHVPLFLVGIGSGSNFIGRMHNPSARAESEIKLLNSHASFSGVRDVTTLDWLHKLGVPKAQLMGDPATFIFNRPARSSHEGHVLIAVPPRRFWSSKRQLWNVYTRGRAMFRSLETLARKLLKEGRDVVLVCNDPLDMAAARTMFDGWLSTPVSCPVTAEEYFELLSNSAAVVSGRLHTAVVAFSLGIPFLLMDVDQRTHGFIKTYQLQDHAVDPSLAGIEARLIERAEHLLTDGLEIWEPLIQKRDEMYSRALDLIGEALSERSEVRGWGASADL